MLSKVTNSNNPFAFTFTDAASSVTWEPWTNGHAVGFRCEYPDSDGNTSVEYLYLNPSATGDGDNRPNVFLYQGVAGDPAMDSAQHWYSPYNYALNGETPLNPRIDTTGE